MSTITVKDSKFASYATLLLRIGIGVGFVAPDGVQEMS